MYRTILWNPTKVISITVNRCGHLQMRLQTCFWSKKLGLFFHQTETDHCDTRWLTKLFSICGGGNQETLAISYAYILSHFQQVQNESSRVWTFVVGAELAVQSQQRRTSTTVHDIHSCSQHCLVLEQTSGSWAGAWMKRATVLVIGGPLVVGSRSWGHTQQSCAGQ